MCAPAKITGHTPSKGSGSCRLLVPESKNRHKSTLRGTLIGAASLQLGPAAKLGVPGACVKIGGGVVVGKLVYEKVGAGVGSKRGGT